MANPNPTPRFAPGNQHGGRTKGARARLSDKFFTALQADFEQHADAVFASVRENDPSTYANLVARLMPKELEARLQIEQKLPANLTTDEWNRLVGLLSLPAELGATGTPEEIAERIERALHAEFAKPVAMIEHAPAMPMVIDAEAVIIAPPPYR
jgi:hypothetical protein